MAHDPSENGFAPPDLTGDSTTSGWLSLSSDQRDLFHRLRAFGPSQVTVRFSMGTEEGYRVNVPASTMLLRGRLRVAPEVDRFAVEISGWGPRDFAWFGRRKGRGRSSYWQGAIEHRTGPDGGAPALVLYFTAELDGLEIAVRELPDGEADTRGE